MTKTSEEQSQSEQPASTAAAAAPTKPSSRKSILALSVIALGINSAAAVYTMTPADFALPNVSMLAELIPHQKISDLMADLAGPASKDVPSAQQQHAAALQENTSLLQQNAARLQQDSIALASLRQSVVDEQVVVKKISAQITDEHEDVKKMSAQISTLIAKVDSLKNAMTLDVTSSIPTKRARNRLSRAAMRNKMARQPNFVGPVSVGGAVLSAPATTSAPQG
ncbi:putative coiled-coil protein SlyX [Bradyrhizobium sp. AZCC 1678]|uniref:hypothetical protein n=1 Tax=Bradyrhizobium sp. AZCC 1678 TaxID=3117030 RepID=UPI002FF35B05